MACPRSIYRIRVIACCLAALLLLGVACSQKNDSDASQTTPVGETSPRDSLMVEIVAEDSLDILSLLQSDHEVVANSSMMGAFVTSIDSVASGGDCYWLFSVNGEMAQAACDKMMVGSGDTVRWHFRCQGD